ncbi:kinase-like protein [Rhizophagus irregularis]|uniref:Kinase-like protein n=1 Tax=Rhizophagus irregularis TaxID=588596 RepID=A0A2N1MRG1_9GLOM|nr:kinase-like protein [Rhizophagus irregularis]
MSYKNEVQVTKYSNEWINCIEEYISKNKNIKYYEYYHFHNIEIIHNDNFGKVYRANWKNSEQYFVLKSLNIDNITVKEIIHELEFCNDVNLHVNIIRFFGITSKEVRNNQAKEYLLVMEYANGNSLRNYLKENFNNLTWEDKYEFAYQLTCAVSHLHDKGISYCGLHPNNILIHQNTIKLTVFGLSKRAKELSNQKSDLIYYIEPKMLKPYSLNLYSSNPYSLNQKSDVYSLGVILWEISSGQPPFKDESYNDNLIMKILKGYRESIVSNTPLDYSILYIECCNNDPDNRPEMNQVVSKLKTIITKNKMILKRSDQLDSTSLTPDNNQLNGDLYQTIQNFVKTNIKELEPTTKNIHKNIFEENLSIVIDELVNFSFKEVNEGKEESTRKKNILNYINNFKINLQEIYNWLLNNQNDSNSIYLLGYFNYHGIIINVYKEKAVELYQKSAELDNCLAQYSLAYLYEDGEGDIKNYDKAFELSKKLAEKEYLSGINLLGYYYYNGIGTDVDVQKAFELFQKAADQGNIRAQCNLADMYIDGEVIDKDDDKAFELSKRSAEGGHSGGMNLLGYCYYKGIGTDIDMEKGFELYQKAANLGNSIAQYNLALMYESGNGTKRDMSQAIYWYKRSSEQGDKDAMYRLNDLNDMQEFF